MNTWSFYRLATGEFTGGVYSGARLPELLPGVGAIEGWHDPQVRCVDLASGAVIERQVTVVPAELAAQCRAERARRLAACDWVVLRAADAGAAVPSAWAAYRNALRDITAQAGFPLDVLWPEPPG